ncbi:MAG: hypothetical protein AAF696_39080 [Bacteroidota bacterium]
MNKGVPASFLDLILCAIAAIVILHTIQPKESEQNYVILYVRVFPQQDPELKLQLYLACEFEGLKFNSTEISRDLNFDIHTHENQATVRLKKSSSTNSLKLFVGIVDDRGQLEKDEDIILNIQSNYTGLIKTARLNADNMYTFFLDEAI